MKFCNLIFIAAFGAVYAKDAETDRKEHHQQTFASGEDLRNLRLLEEHVPTESRIVGGVNADVGEYPFFVKWAGCGASLIHPDIVLSAAHCFPIGEDEVRVGASRTGFFLSEEEGGVRRTIDEKVRHPLYSDITLDYDFMVMKLDDVVDIEPISLNDDGQSPSNGAEVTVIGFGSQSEGGSTVNTLQEVNVNYIPTADCNDAYNGEINGNTMMCAGVGGGKDSCQGDSGGPIFEMRNGEPVQVGIVSWGFGCARPEFPGVYSRVSGELDWIRAKICQLSSVKPDYCDDIGGGSDEGEVPGDGDISVRLDITYDAYPVENSWTVRRGLTTIASKAPGTLLTPGLVQERLNLSPGVHNFEMRDTFGDGICCTFGDGKVEIYAETATGDVLLAATDGQFGAIDAVQFVVPNADGNVPTAPASATTPAPIVSLTPAPVVLPPTSAPVVLPPTTSPVVAPVAFPTKQCEDSNGTFLADDVAGTRGCTWLDQNLVNYGYLCKFVEIASKCKVTCSACDLFQPRE